MVNSLGFLISHRLPIAVASKECNYEVVIAFGEGRQSEKKQLEKMGFICQPFFLKRGSTNIFFEARTFFSLYQIISRWRPDILHLITIKPYLYGGMLARLCKTPAVISAVAGLGSLLSWDGLFGKVRRLIVLWVFRFAFGHKNQLVILQNTSDQGFLINAGVLNIAKCKILPGSGVDLDDFIVRDFPNGQPVVIFTGRLLKEKGILDFIAAARILSGRSVPVAFWVAGDRDPGNPSSVDTMLLEQWKSEKIVKILGHRRDISNLISQSMVVCLPSFYGEGLPKSLIEAAAAGRAVVTTDHPGCRDAIVPDVTGMLVPVRNPLALADAIQALVTDKERCQQMGREGRVLAEQRYSVGQIVNAHLAFYSELLNRA